MVINMLFLVAPFFEFAAVLGLFLQQLRPLVYHPFLYELSQLLFCLFGLIGSGQVFVIIVFSSPHLVIQAEVFFL